mmetsp:Transcript_1442/g.5921  ORF Transcript_1442/g.5921 Transcript_1442/m.5921 type:complete len:204 (-) Transcript_1442:2236-2847(-)
MRPSSFTSSHVSKATSRQTLLSSGGTYSSPRYSNTSLSSLNVASLTAVMSLPRTRLNPLSCRLSPFAFSAHVRMDRLKYPEPVKYRSANGISSGVYIFMSMRRCNRLGVTTATAPSPSAPSVVVGASRSRLSGSLATPIQLTVPVDRSSVTTPRALSRAKTAGNIPSTVSTVAPGAPCDPPRMNSSLGQSRTSTSPQEVFPRR